VNSIELFTVLDDLLARKPDVGEVPVLLPDGIGGWFTVIDMVFDEDRLILRLEPWA
jgi:hypothetical protein